MTDINGNNTETTFTTGLTTDTIQDLSDTSHITLTTDTIDLVATNVLVNGAPIGGGGDGIQNPLTSNLNISTFDVVNNTGLSLTGINTKTQNITSTSGYTTISGSLTVGEAITPIILPMTTTTINSFISSGYGSFGMKFTILKTATIVRIGVQIGSWTNASITSLKFNFFSEGNTTAIYSYVVPRANIYESCYSLLIPSMVLPAGTYRYAVALAPTMTYYNPVLKPLVMNSQLSLVEAAYDLFNPTGGYPTNLSGDLDFTYSGFMWLVDNTYKIQTPLLQTDKVVINGGTSSQYLMADGTKLQFSANSGNSNFYLYRSDTSMAITPPNGNITYNNATQLNATIIYISHLTRDNIDIEIFFKQISTLSEVYIQDQNLSEAFMQFNVTGTPTITVNNKVAIPVLARSAGVGITGFPDGHQVLLSFFTNTLETDQRISLVESKTTNISSVSVGVNTQFQGTITADSINTAGALSTSGLTTGAVVLTGLANMDVEVWSRPFIGLQFIHNNPSLTTLSNSPWTISGNALVVSPFATTDNRTRQLCCVITTPSGSANGTTTGITSTSLTGARVITAYSFGLVAAFGIADTGTTFLANCQNFVGLWNVAPAIILNQTTQLSDQRNMICFGSNTTDANLCIYTGGASSTVKQVDLGVYFPSGRLSAAVMADWFKLSLYWDGTTVYYRAINTLYPTTALANISGSFTPLATDMPPTTTAMYPQILRIMGTPSGAAQGKLQIQRFGIIL